jgi:hypothetical protein
MSVPATFHLPEVEKSFLLRQGKYPYFAASVVVEMLLVRPESILDVIGSLSRPLTGAQLSVSLGPGYVSTNPTSTRTLMSHYESEHIKRTVSLCVIYRHVLAILKRNDWHVYAIELFSNYFHICASWNKMAL